MLEYSVFLAIDSLELALLPVILMAPIRGMALYHAADVSGKHLHETLLKNLFFFWYSVYAKHNDLSQT